MYRSSTEKRKIYFILLAYLFVYFVGKQGMVNQNWFQQLSKSVIIKLIIYVRWFKMDRLLNRHIVKNQIKICKPKSTIFNIHENQHDMRKNLKQMYVLIIFSTDISL